MPHWPVFLPENWVYVNKSPAAQQNEAASATNDQSLKLATKEDGLCCVLAVKDYTRTVDIRRIFDIVLIDFGTLAETHEKVKPATGISQGEQTDKSAGAESRPTLDDNDSNHPQKDTVEKHVADNQQDYVTQYRVWEYGHCAWRWHIGTGWAYTPSFHFEIPIPSMTDSLACNKADSATTY